MISSTATTPSLSNSPILKVQTPASTELDQKLIQHKLAGFSMDSTRFASSALLLSPKDSVDLTVASTLRETSRSVSTAVKFSCTSIKLDPQQGDQVNVAEIFTEPNMVRKEKKFSSILKKSSLYKASSEEMTDRSDSKGIPILRGGKKHSLAFQAKIHSVALVDNWKEYNKEDKHAFCHCRQF